MRKTLLLVGVAIVFSGCATDPREVTPVDTGPEDPIESGASAQKAVDAAEAASVTSAPWTAESKARGYFNAAAGWYLSYHVFLDSCAFFSLDVPSGTTRLDVKLDLPLVNTTSPGVGLVEFDLLGPVEARVMSEGGRIPPIDMPEPGRWEMVVFPKGAVANGKFEIVANAEGVGDGSLFAVMPAHNVFSC